MVGFLLSWLAEKEAKNSRTFLFSDLSSPAYIFVSLFSIQTGTAGGNTRFVSKHFNPLVLEYPLKKIWKSLPPKWWHNGLAYVKSNSKCRYCVDFYWNQSSTCLISPKIDPVFTSWWCSNRDLSLHCGDILTRAPFDFIEKEGTLKTKCNFLRVKHDFLYIAGVFLLANGTYAPRGSIAY